jgi:polyisoprenoid-binding protein YceI
LNDQHLLEGTMTITYFDSAPTAAIDDLTGEYSIDVAHTRIGFTARHAMVTSVRGSFQDFEGSAHLDAGDPAKSSPS